MAEHETAQHEPEDGEWRPCAAGELTGFAARARLRRQHQVFRRVAAVLIVLAAAFGLAKWVNQGLVQDLTCREVQALMAQHADARLDSRLAKRVDYHLDHCRHCRQEWNDLRRVEAFTPPVPLASVSRWP